MERQKQDRGKRLRQIAQAAVLSAASTAPAWCQGGGTIDASGFRNVIGFIVAIALALGACFVIWQFVLAVQAWRGNEMKEVMNHLLPALIGGVIVGFATAWTASLTGINIVAQNIFG